MEIPVRCFTCGRVIANLWETYKANIVAGQSAKDVLDQLGLRRFCCRRMLLTHVDLSEKLIAYSSVDTKDGKCEKKS